MKWTLRMRLESPTGYAHSLWYQHFLTPFLGLYTHPRNPQNGEWVTPEELYREDHATQRVLWKANEDNGMLKKKFYFIYKLGCLYKATFMQIHNGLKSHSPHSLLTHSPVPLVSFVPLQLRWFPWQLYIHNRVSIKHGGLRRGNIGDTCLCTCKQLNHLRDRGGGRSKRERE